MNAIFILVIKVYLTSPLGAGIQKNHGASQFQTWSFLCESSLTTGPRFVETPAMTALGGYVTGTRGTSLCGAKTQQG